MSATNALLARPNLPLQVLIPIGTVVVLENDAPFIGVGSLYIEFLSPSHPLKKGAGGI